MITKFLNEIRTYIDPITEKVEYTFVGDGFGDFEEYKTDVSEEVLYNYIEELDRQKKLAQKILMEKKNAKEAF